MARQSTVQTPDRNRRTRSPKSGKSVIGRTMVYALLIGLMVVFGGIGGYFLYGEYRATHEFRPVNARITQSKVGIHQSDGSTTYSVDIRFTYTVKGRTYTEGRWNWLKSSSSGRDAKARIVAQYPVGKICTGYYDPDDPSVAVLNREYSFLGLVFFALGIGIPGFILAVITFGYGNSTNKKRTGVRSTSGTGRAETSRARHVDRRWPRYWSRKLQNTFVELPPASTPVQKAVTIAFVALIWNGITWGIIIATWRNGSPSIFGTVFMSIFVLLGFLLAYAVIHQLLSGIKARPARLAVDPPEALLGGRLRILVGQELKRRTRIDGLKLTVTCKEWIRYTVGTNTRTETHELSKETFTLAEPAEQESTQPLTGEVTIDIPAGAMHSFNATNNKVQWAAKVTLEVPRWPDTTTEFPLMVLPRMAVNTTAEAG